MIDYVYHITPEIIVCIIRLSNVIIEMTDVVIL